MIINLLEPMSDTASPHRQSGLAHVLHRYITGDVARPFLDRVMRLLDASDATPTERSALAAFMGDAVRDVDPARLKLPRLKELEMILAETRRA